MLMTNPAYKVYHDGSAYVGFFPTRRKPMHHPPKRKTVFDEAFSALFFSDEYRKLDTRKPNQRQQKIDGITEDLRPLFSKFEGLRADVERNIDREDRNAWLRKKRLFRKAYLHPWNYWVTFTYSDEKMTESQFQKKIRRTLSNFATRRGWKYIGVWERGEDGDRLHMHALLYIPAGQFVGELVEIEDYDKKHGRMQTTMQNTFFNDRFGRSTFEEITRADIVHGGRVEYMAKYMTKSETRAVYSRGLPTEILIEVPDEEIEICPTIENDFVIKYVLFNETVEAQRPKYERIYTGEAEERARAS